MRVSVATLRVFAAVAESGSIRSAGEKLGRTPSSISEQLKLFENEIGAPLFEGGRKNRLTTVGQFVRSQVRDMLIHYDRTLSAVEAFARNATGRVDIASVPSVATTVLPDVIIEFRNRAPTVEITVRDADSRSVADMVQAGTIELGLGSKPVDRRAIAFEPLFSEPLGIVCRRDDPLFKSARPHGWSSVEDRVLLTNAISDRSAATGEPPTRPTPIIVYNVLSLMALVRANVGVTILPRLAVINAPADIGFVPLNEPDAKRTVGVITRAGESLSPASTSFLDLVRDHIRTSASRFGLDLLGTAASNAASSRRQAAG